MIAGEESRRRDHPTGARFRKASAIARDAEEKAMRNLVVPIGRVIVILLLLAGLSVCTMSDQAANTPPEGALSFDQLLEGLDGLQGTATQSPSAPGMSVFRQPDGSLFSSADLSAYLNAIKRDLAAYIYSCTGGKPYLVVARPLVWGDTDPVAPGVQQESALMWVPVTWWGRPVRSPVIALQHGTQVFRGCAPSLFNVNPLSVLASPDLTGALQNYVECIVGALMATAGYTVVMPDYAGFGASTAPHPYVNRRLGYSVQGAIMAARAAVLASGVSLRPETYLTGYSEGGYATMAGAWALQEVAHTPATKIVPCDGAYSLSEVMRLQMLSAEPIIAPHYLLYTASGYSAVEATMPPLADVLAHDWDDVAAAYFDGSRTNAEVAARVSASVPPVTMLTTQAADDLAGRTGAVFGLLQANDSWTGWTSGTRPVFVHCRYDDVVPFANAEAAVGVYGGTIHEVGYVPFVEAVMGSIHVAAFPTAMLEAFKIIRN
jgi:pimeloyl-ACP methyl ester carboxylesterase